MSSPDPLAEYRSGSLEPWTADVLCALILALRPSCIIETGTYMGLTTRRFLQAANEIHKDKICRVWTVEMDVERAKQAWVHLETMRTNLTMTIGDAIDFLKGFSDQADFIFLDDDHKDTHVREEIRLALKILRPGGIVAVHDVVGGFGLGDVVKEYGGIVLDLPRLHSAGGLGLICR